MIILEILALMLLFFVLGNFVYSVSNGKIFAWLYHNVLGQHICGKQGYDGCSFTGRCSVCGKRCLMDSQGNWFETSVQDVVNKGGVKSGK